MPSPYRELLGPEWDRLAAPLRDFHDVETVWEGKAVFRVTRGSGLLRNILAWLGGLPPAGESVPVTLRCTCEKSAGRTVEIWDRHFDGFRMRSMQWAEGGRLVEKFGWISLGYRLRVEPSLLRLEVTNAWFAGVPIPLWLAPTGEGLERADPDGRLSIRAVAYAPFLGQIVCYEGILEGVNG